ncbi:MAG: beta-N-acetylhexosaminidase [Acutalibacteraceae bacterium]
MIHLIPMPENLITTNDYYSFDRNNVSFFFSPELECVSKMCEQILDITFQKSEKPSQISFIYDDSEEKEGYSLIIDKGGVRVFASDYNGAFYAAQTLRQLFETDLKDKKRLACQYVKISCDKPKYRWRGLQLDESRHFFGKETVKRLLDFMAMYKLNIFHWHLTDDQGWRIEVEKYPLLTEIGSKRSKSQLHNWNCTETDDVPVEGFYTKEDVAEIVSYAKERCIEIVPEVDFPAHCAAVLACYNELACREIPCRVPYYFGGKIPEMQGNKSWNRTLCLGKEEVYDFVKDVIDEVAAMFPFEYFHIGGDEAPTEEWEKCPHCQEKMKRENLKDATELQGYFSNRLSEHLLSIGKIPIGWNEVLKAKGISRDITVQYWTPQKDKNVTTHLKEGGKVIMSCHRAFYFDMPYSMVKVKNTYNFNPVSNNVPKENLDSVLGVEGENWSEWTDSEKQLFFKLAPRVPALSENAWTPDSARNYDSFEKRYSRHKLYLQAQGMYLGQDKLTIKSSKLYKMKKGAKNSISLKDYDAEYRISLCEDE